ncbi:MAG: tRNA-binding protein [Candidatus Diapherotrites archaeon]|nr:tRNA-binding protein [Candidatus Diapherotrites archaeon]
MATFEEFRKIDVRTGKIISVEEFPEARNPTYKIQVDFGPGIGIKRSCAHLTHYRKEELIGRTIVAIINFPPKQIANAISEILILGVPGENVPVALLSPDQNALIGSRVF